MKRSCKHIDISDADVILPFVSECIEKHKRRYDFRDLLLTVGGMTMAEYECVLDGNFTPLDRAEWKIALEAAKRIRNRDLKLPPVELRERKDKSSFKVRIIGKECAMQQIFDYIVVRSCKEIWDRRFVPQQASSIKYRGQVYGTNMISTWIKRDNRNYQYCMKHGIRYARQCKYYVKLDIRKCYPSLRVDVFMKYFRRDCGNEDILWLYETLLKSHRVGGYEGFMIGAYPSQQGAQYLLSFIYRYMMSLYKERRGKKLRLVTHGLLFMDDILILGSAKSNLKRAVKAITDYAKTFFWTGYKTALAN